MRQGQAVAVSFAGSSEAEPGGREVLRLEESAPRTAPGGAPWWLSVSPLAGPQGPWRACVSIGCKPGHSLVNATVSGAWPPVGSCTYPANPCPRGTRLWVSLFLLSLAMELGFRRELARTRDWWTPFSGNFPEQGSTKHMAHLSTHPVWVAFQLSVDPMLGSGDLEMGCPWSCSGIGQEMTTVSF